MPEKTQKEKETKNPTVDAVPVVPASATPVILKAGGGVSKHPVYRWFFTLKMESINECQLCQDLEEISKQFVFQGEEGKDGYRHWQGCFSLNLKERFATVKNYFPNDIHLEQCKDWHKSVAYCTKSEGRIKGPFRNGHTFVDVIKSESFYPWQKALESELVLTKPNDRTVIWIADPQGSNGKTQFARYMFATHNCQYLENASKKDIAQALVDDPKIVIFGMTRSFERRVSYDSIESIKDGLMFAAKYKSRARIFNSPHVVILANFYPDQTRLTADRWDIRTINNDHELVTAEDNDEDGIEI